MGYILVVEDYKPLRIALKRLLEAEGYTVEVAEHGADALRKMEAGEPPALIISDIMMPVMDGYEFYDAVRAVKSWATIPFLFLTAKGTEEDVLRGKRLGAEDYIIKPISEETLLAAVAGRLNRAEALKQAQKRTVENFLQEMVQTLLGRLQTPVGELDRQVLDTFNHFSADDPDRVVAYLTHLRRTSDELVTVSERLLWLVRLQSGELAREIELSRQPFAAWHELVQEAWETCGPQVRTRIPAVQEMLPPDLPTVVCSPVWTGRALTLLFEQGVELLPKQETRLVLGGEVDATFLRLTLFLPGAFVSQNGWEVLMHRPTSMERFTSERFHLYLAREIMLLQGGELDLVTAPNGVRLSLLLRR